tara:strand:+ start:675 stop:908 length:234 start_codon:yes stop_codon:yes gene_type:complete
MGVEIFFAVIFGVFLGFGVGLMYWWITKKRESKKFSKMVLPDKFFEEKKKQQEIQGIRNDHSAKLLERSKQEQIQKG